jgi:hypothetical protein
MEVAFAEKGFEVGAGNRKGRHDVRFSFAYHGAVPEGCQGSGRPPGVPPRGVASAAGIRPFVAPRDDEARLRLQPRGGRL